MGIDPFTYNGELEESTPPSFPSPRINSLKVGWLDFRFLLRFNPIVTKCSMSVKLGSMQNHGMTRLLNGLYLEKPKCAPWSGLMQFTCKRTISLFGCLETQ